MSTGATPLPDIDDPDTGFFWQGTARHELHVKHCADCMRDHWPPRLGCPHCGSDRVGWRAVVPTGTLYSWTVIHRSVTPGFGAATPYVVVLVVLDHARDVRMIGNVPATPDDASARLADGSDLFAGMPMHAAFTPSRDGGVTLVNWRPVAGVAPLA